VAENAAQQAMALLIMGSHLAQALNQVSPPSGTFGPLLMQHLNLVPPAWHARTTAPVSHHQPICTCVV